MDATGEKDKAASELRAFVLCGGLGTRLRSVVADRPKSMALIGDVPFLQILLEDLKAQGVRDIVLGTGYRAEQIEGYFGVGEKIGLRILYSRENEPLGTGGAVKLAENRLSDPVLVLNGDSYVDWDLAAVRNLFREKKADIVMVLQEVPDVSRYGSVTFSEDGRLIEFVEKGSRTGSGLINAGIYLLRKEIVQELPAASAISLEREVFPPSLGEKFFGVVARGTFIDIGIPADLARAQTVLHRGS